MRTFSAGVDTALAKESIVAVPMILFDFPSGYWGFWFGLGSFPWNSITWRGSGSAIELSYGGDTGGLGAKSATARLRAIPDTSLDADCLATIEAETYSQRPVIIYTSYWDRDTRALIAVEQEFDGVVDKFDHEETGDGDYVLVGRFKSRSADYSRRGASIRSNAQQDLISSGDKFFDFVTTVAEKEIYFGRKQTSGGNRFSGSPV